MVDLAGARVLAVLTRAPSSGGKTRLFASLGVPPDTKLLEALLLDTIEGAAAPEIAVVVAVTPASACEEVRTLLHASAARRIDVIAQADGDLGQRMHATMVSLFERGAAAVAVIGSDLPHITAATIREAFDALAAEPDAVILGPAGDGGYYLVAATHVPDVFDGIDWSTSRVLEQTMRAAADRGLQIRLVKPFDDIDSADDLRRVATYGRAPRTTTWFQAVRH